MTSPRRFDSNPIELAPSPTGDQTADASSRTIGLDPQDDPRIDKGEQQPNPHIDPDFPDDPP